MQDQEIRFIDRPYMAVTKNAEGIERIVGHYKNQRTAVAVAENIEGGFVAFTSYIPNSAQLEEI